MRSRSYAWIVAFVVAALTGGTAYLLAVTFKSQTVVGLSTIVALIVGGATLGSPILSRIRSSYRRRQLNVRTGTSRMDEADDNYKDDSKLLDPSQYRSAEEYRLALYRRQGHQAENEISAYLPANPRRAKRLINHQRLYARIAEDRGVFGGEPELTHLHLAKWVLIIEEWPRLGAALTLDPSWIEILEESSTLGTLRESIDAIAPGVGVTDELLRVLHGEIRLSPIFVRLVRFGAPK